MSIKTVTLLLISTLLVSYHALGQQVCKDSPLSFKLDGVAHTCYTDVRNEDSLCAAGGTISGFVSNHCPSMCDVTDCTGIESDMRFQVLLETSTGGTYEPTWKNCQWVTLKNTCNRCAKQGIRDTCPLSCSGCPLPVNPPVSNCVNSPLNFRYNQEEWSCDVVNNTRTDLCPLGGAISGVISTHCPLACGVSDCTNEESQMYFKVPVWKNGSTIYKWKKCEWVGLKCSQRCLKDGIAETCPVTCSQC